MLLLYADFVSSNFTEFIFSNSFFLWWKIISLSVKIQYSLDNNSPFTLRSGPGNHHSLFYEYTLPI